MFKVNKGGLSMSKDRVLKLLNREVERYKRKENVSKTVILIQLNYYKREKLIEEKDYNSILSRLEKIS